jgi:hypothetical protein
MGGEKEGVALLFKRFVQGDLFIVLLNGRAREDLNK